MPNAAVGALAGPCVRCVAARPRRLENPRRYREATLAEPTDQPPQPSPLQTAPARETREWAGGSLTGQTQGARSPNRGRGCSPVPDCVNIHG
jgi:hypothetical protein